MELNKRRHRRLAEYLGKRCRMLAGFQHLIEESQDLFSFQGRALQLGMILGYCEAKGLQHHMKQGEQGEITKLRVTGAGGRCLFKYDFTKPINGTSMEEGAGESEKADTTEGTAL